MKFERNPDKVRPAVTLKIMWPEGPTREWRSGNAGRYVCQACQVPVIGVYRVKQGVQVANPGISWVCAKCKKGDFHAKDETCSDI